LFIKATKGGKVATKVYNFRLEDAVVKLLDRMAAMAGIKRSRALRQSVAALAAIQEAAITQTIDRLQVLRERYGDDAQLTAVASQAEDGTPLGHLMIDGEAPEGAHVFPAVVPGEKVLLFLNIPGRGQLSEAVLASFGDTGIFVPEARLPLGEVPWPPDPTKGIVMRLGDLDQIIEAEPTLKEPIEV
jgi:hypothetical protein